MTKVNSPKISLQQSYEEDLPPDSPYYIPTEYQGRLQPNFFCRGWNEKRQKYCRAEAGRGTDHKGTGRCRIHGGAAPIKHGRYSEVPRGAIAELQKEFELETEEEKLNVLPEATLMRAIIGNYIEKYEEYSTAILAFNEMEEQEARIEKRKAIYLRCPSLKDIIEMLEKASNVVDKINKHKSTNAISMKDFLRVQMLQAQIVNDELSEIERKLKLSPSQVDVVQESKMNIANKWKDIKVKTR